MMVRYLITSFITCIAMLGFGSFCYASSAVSLGFGMGTKKIHAQRISLQRSWFPDRFGNRNSKFNGYWEFAVSRMRTTQAFSYYTAKNLGGASISGAIRIHKQFLLPLYIDLGLGLAYLSKHDIASRELGSNTLFEDRVGVGILLGRGKNLEIGYRAMHYSNAYLAKRNNGLNLHLFLIGYWFN